MARTAGSKNKVSGYARKRFAELECDPLERAIHCANLMYDEGDIDKAGRLYIDLIAYIHPKLAAMQVSQDADNPISFNITVGSK